MFDDLRAKANSFEYDQYVSKKKKHKKISLAKRKG